MGNEKNERGLDRRRLLQSAAAAAAGMALSGAAAGRVFADEGDKAKSDLVKRRPLGKTGIEGSVIVYGCGGLGTEHLPLLQAALERGINMYDVAWGYRRGQAEVAIGKFVETLKDRKQIHIITKASGFRTPRGSSKEVYAALKSSVTESLERMKTDYIDVLYYPHGASNPSQFKNGAMNDALEKLKEEKLVKHLGSSSHTNYARVAAEAIEKSYCDVFMPVANICTQNPAAAGQPAKGRRGRGRAIEDTRKVLEAAGKKKVGLVAMKVANGGYLTDATDKLLEKEFPKDSELSRHQKLYAYMLKQSGVSGVAVGIRSAKHLREAITVGTQA